jgi:hypothetical protein
MTGGVFSGCNGLFTPAIPEPPSGRPIVPHYETVEATLNTMKLAIAAKGQQGNSAWLGAFDEQGYHQDFDDRDVSVFEGACQCKAPKDWGFAQEQNFYLSFIAVRPSDEYVAMFDSVENDPDTPPAPGAPQVIHRHYQVLANAPDGNSTLIIAIGKVDLTFTESSGRWLVTRWADRVDSTVTEHPVDPWQLTFGRRRLESTQ